MSATGEDQDIADALLVTCGLCRKPPGEACVNSVNGVGPREQPHWNRVIRGRRENLEANALPSKWEGSDYLRRQGESTSARLRRVEQERDSLLAHNQHLIDVSRERDDARGALVLARRQRDVAEQERDLARAELASALTELEQLRAELARRSA